MAEDGLVAELLSKLAGLNARVATFQQNIVRQFEADMEARLKGYPDAVVSEVRRVIAASMSNYPALCRPTSPVLVDVAEHPHGWVGSQSPPPSGVFKNDIKVKDGLQSPPLVTQNMPSHPRELDLAGVFTPGYLPLLGDSHRPQQSSSSSSAPRSPAVSSTTSSASGVTLVPEKPVLATEEGKQPATTAPDLPPRPIVGLPPANPPAPGSAPSAPPSQSTMLIATASSTPARPPTMPSTTPSSTTSCSRRSALRRSSSVSQKSISPRHTSPRQVRFSHDGEEVLPTASPPKNSPMSIPHSLRHRPAGSQDFETEDADSRPGDEMIESSDESVYTKKITSTQKLQALGRMPDEGSHVKEVPGGESGAPIGYIVSVNGEAHTLRAPEPGSDLMAADSTDLTLTTPVEELFERAQSQPLDDDIMLASLKTPSKVFKAGHDGSLDLQDDSRPINIKPSNTKPTEVEESEDDFVEMKALPKSPRTPDYFSKKNPFENSLSTLPAKSNGSSKTAATEYGPLKRTTSKGSLADLQSQSGPSKPPKATLSADADTLSADADPFFGMGDDDEDLQGDDKYSPSDVDDDANENDDDDTPVPDSTGMPIIGTPSKPTPITKASPSAALFSPVAGSYRGSSFSFGPTKNAVLYDEIAGMKDVHTFIGSIDGRTGLDSVDAGSYRAAMTKNMGAHPKSFTEKLALEEAMERRESEEDEDTAVEHAEQVEKLEKLEKLEKPEKSEKPEKPEKLEKLEKPEKLEKAE